MYLPNDPAVLGSALNTKLRDFYDNLEELCDTEDVDKDELFQRLQAAGFRYDGEQNQIR